MIKVDNCKDFDGFVCKTCGRQLPDACKNQEDLEAKAAAFDRIVAEKETKVDPEEPKVHHTHRRKPKTSA